MLFRSVPFDLARRQIADFRDEREQTGRDPGEVGILREAYVAETEQAVYVIDGEIELFGDETTVLGAGDTFVVGPGTEHGVRGRAEETQLIDAFTPPIAEYAKR